MKEYGGGSSSLGDREREREGSKREIE